MPQITYINEIYDILKAQIQSTQADIYPDIPFVEASGDFPLEQQIFGDRLDGCRRFHLLFGPSGGFNAPEILNWNGSLLTLQDTLIVRIRYEFGNEDGGYLAINRLVASDTQLVVRTIHPLVCLPLIDYVPEIKPNGTLSIKEISKEDSKVTAFILEIQFDYTIFLGD